MDMQQSSAFFSPRTDLAVEVRDMLAEKEKIDTKGIISEERTENGIVITEVKITADGAEKTGKNAGTYVTIYAEGVKKQDTGMQQAAQKVLAAELRKLIQSHKIDEKQKGLIVGLGNWHVTPDALGPMTTEKILVTSHLFELEREDPQAGYRPVAAVAPGVMGVTGMETSDIIFGIVSKFKPDFIIAIDALAARAVERLNETIQLSDAGIHPGSGIGNKRKALSQETLGVPVFAIGVPTVVDAVTIASDAMDDLLKHFGKEWRNQGRPSQSLLPAGFHFGKEKLTDADLPDMEKRKAVLGLIGELSEEDKRALISEVLTPIDRNLIVTPKEVDGFMEDMSHLIASAINAALHRNIPADESGSYTR